MDRDPYSTTSIPMLPFEFLIAAGVQFTVARTVEGTCMVTGPGTTHFVYTPPEQVKIARCVGMCLYPMQ